VKQITRPKATLEQRARQAYPEWLHDLAPWALAASITIRPYDPITRLPVERQHIVRSVKYYLKRLNGALFGHASMRRGHRVGSVFVVEYGASGEHPHAHLTITRPEHVEWADLERHARRLIRKNSLFRREYEICRYSSANWHSYCVKSGCDHLVAEDIQDAKP
jgi:hypothetical protein